MILRISTHARNFCSITLWCTTFDQYFNIGSIPHGDSEFFLCPTLVTRWKKHFSLFQYWSCYTTNVLWQQRRKKHCNCINFVHTNNVYFWKLYSYKIHLLHPVFKLTHHNWVLLRSKGKDMDEQKKFQATCALVFVFLELLSFNCVILC